MRTTHGGSPSPERGSSPAVFIPPPSLFLAHTFSFARSPFFVSRALSLCLFRSPSLARALARSLALPVAALLSLSLSRARSLFGSRSRSLSLSLSLALSHTRTTRGGSYAPASSSPVRGRFPPPFTPPPFLFLARALSFSRSPSLYRARSRSPSLAPPLSRARAPLNRSPCLSLARTLFLSLSRSLSLSRARALALSLSLSITRAFSLCLCRSPSLSNAYHARRFVGSCALIAREGQIPPSFHRRAHP